MISFLHIFQSSKIWAVNLHVQIVKLINTFISSQSWNLISAVINFYVAGVPTFLLLSSIMVYSVHMHFIDLFILCKVLRTVQLTSNLIDSWISRMSLIAVLIRIFSPMLIWLDALEFSFCLKKWFLFQVSQVVYPWFMAIWGRRSEPSKNRKLHATVHVWELSYGQVSWAWFAPPPLWPNDALSRAYWR